MQIRFPFDKVNVDVFLIERWSNGLVEESRPKEAFLQVFLGLMGYHRDHQIEQDEVYVRNDFKF